jgi:glycosyltransferase involved in cell wall biosynthesis
MEKPRSVVLIGPAWPLRGGLATYNERLAREYTRQGAAVSIYTFSLQYPSLLFPGKTQYSDEPRPQDLRICVTVNSINPFNWIRIGYKIKKQKPDLVIAKFWIPFMAPCLGTICRIIRNNRHTRVVSVIDNIIPHESRPGDRLLARYWTGSVDGFIAMSKAVLLDLETFDRQKPKSFCPHPLYDNFGDPVPRQEALKELGLDQGFRYLLFFGFIRDYKGLDLLLQAMADRRLAASDIKLIVAGEFYCDPAPYHRIISENRLEEKVILRTDFIPDSKVYLYFCASDLVVQPYKSATQSGVTQIAYHFDKPMVITDVGGLSEIVPDGVVGYVVQPEPSAIADAVLRFFESGVSEAFAINASKEKVKYSWKRLTDAIDCLV